MILGCGPKMADPWSDTSISNKTVTFTFAGTHAHYIVYVIKHTKKINKVKWKNTSIDILEMFSLNSSSGLSDRVLEVHAPILEGCIAF